MTDTPRSGGIRSSSEAEKGDGNFDIEFGEVPPSDKFSHVPRRASRLDKASEALRARPGEWARIARATSSDPKAFTSTASAINRGVPQCFMPRGSFEAVRRVVDGRVEIWARFTGIPETATTVVADPPPSPPTPKQVVAAPLGPKSAQQSVFRDLSKPGPDMSIICADCGHARRLHDPNIQMCRRTGCLCDNFKERGTA